MKISPKFRVIPLGDLCDVTGGNSAPQGEEFFSGGTIPFVRMRDLGAYHHTTHLGVTRDAVTQDAIQQKRLKIFDPGCILFPRSGSVALNHRAILGIRAAIVSHIGILHELKAGIDVRYLYWFLVRYNMGEIAKQTTGLDLVSFSDVKKIAVPVPETLEAQRLIVADIEKQFTRLDAGVAALRRVQANLKRYRAAVLRAACEGRLVPTEAELQRSRGSKAKAFETGAEHLHRILAERRKNWTGRGKYKEPVGPDTSKLAPLAEGWTWASLEQLTSAIRPICYGILMPKENIESGVPYVKVKDMRGDQIDLAGLHRTAPEIAAKYARSSLKFGDLLLSIRGTFGRVAEVPKDLGGGNITQDTARLDVTHLVSHRYVATFVRNPSAQNYLKRVARGVAVKGVNIGDLRPMPIPCPPLAEQTRIVAEVERRLSVVDRLELLASASLQRAARLRQAILERAFAGNL